MKTRQAFTIIEVVLVMFIIGLISVLIFFGYSTIKSNAEIASLKSDLTNAAEELDVFQFKQNQYPTTINCSIPDSSTNLCLKFTSGRTVNYVPYNNETPDRYYLSVTLNTTVYKIIGTAGSAVPTPVDRLTKLITCPTGFIWVPGSSTYNTGDFCVMKYEAKADGNGDGIGDAIANANNTSPASTYPISSTRQLVSSAAGYPVAYITQTEASTVASSYTKNCVYCHLITEAEWMTIAQNIFSVGSNWSGGSMGSGAVYWGNNDATPSKALEADTNDSNGYYGTGDSSNSGADQRRTLALSNGEIIWDFAGNLWEWTNGQMTGGQPSQCPSGSYNLKQWNTVSGGGFTVNPYPSNMGLNGASTWTTSQGIGMLYCNSSVTTQVGFYRGGAFGVNGAWGGVLTLFLIDTPSTPIGSVGFRVTR